jgi:hypothetical protein
MHKKSWRPRLSVVVAALTVWAAFAGTAPTPTLAQEGEDAELVLRMIGREVRVRLASGFALDAKVDTGADSSSIDARNIEPFERDDEDWVRFEVMSNDGQNATLERRVVETVTIISSSGREERYVVELDVCVGDLMLPTEVNLANREGLDFRMLIGRGFLVRGHFLVNPAQAFAIEPACDDMIQR